MTREEAIEYFEENFPQYVCELGPSAKQLAFNIAIECIQHCIDEENSECYNCTDKHCDNCIYSGRI